MDPRADSAQRQTMARDLVYYIMYKEGDARDVA